MKTLYIVLGSISLALGILGIFLPLLPTTPFLLLTAALYFKGSPRLYNWLLNHRHFGPYIRNFRENKAIPLRAKIISLVLMWGTMLLQSPNQKIPDRKTKCVIKTHINIKQNVIFGAKLKPV